jgi:hypothetical protein
MTSDEIRALILFCKDNNVQFLKIHDTVEFAMFPPVAAEPSDTLGFEGNLNLRDPFSESFKGN